MKISGSQRSETLREAGYELIKRFPDGEMIVQDEGGKFELWHRQDDHAGYVLRLGSARYEFVRSLPATEALALLGQ